MINGKDYIFSSEDLFYESSASTLDFKVEADGVEVYEAHAEQFPDGTPIRIYINRIAKDYLSHGTLPTATGLTTDGGAFKLFDITTPDSVGSVWVADGHGKNMEDGKIFSDPINGLADQRMFLFITRIGTTADTENFDVE